MQELRFVAVSEDGSYAVLAIPGRSGRFMLPIDDRLRAVAKGQFSRLAQYEIEVENPLRPKEIQARIRAGETAEEIADAAGIPVDRVRWFEGPVLAERGYVAQQAQSASVRRQGDSTPGPRLGEIVAERLTELGADPEDAQWDSRKHGDGSWQVQLAFRAGGRLHIAEWLFDPRRRHVLPADENADRLSLPEAELPAPTSGTLGAATVTPIRPRPDRSQAPAPQHAAEETFAEPARAAAHAAAPASFAPPRPPVGRPPSHAAPQPGRGSRTAAADSAEPGERDHNADEREHSRASGQDQTERLTADGAVAEHVATQAPAAREAATREAGPRDQDASVPAAQPAAAAPTRAGDDDAAKAPAQPPAQAPAEKRADEVPPRGRGKKAAGPRGRRSSVPSWDEIMLGNSRQPD